MEQITHIKIYLLPLLISALALTGCSQLQNKKAKKNKTKITSASSINKKANRSFSAKDILGKNGLLSGGSDLSGSTSIDTIDSSGTSEIGLDPESQAAIDAKIQATIDTLMAEGKKKPLASVDKSKQKNMLAQRIIYFDYDQSNILEKYEPILAAHAELLANNPEIRVRLEGHADERGSREYNVALSERRAETVRQYLSFNNVASKQMETVAFGEERPLVSSHNDAAWSKNRRVEINYITY
jgi:peptidoglycan-associated lipoprotein